MKYKGNSKIKIKVDRKRERNYIARDMKDSNGAYRPKVIQDKRKKYRTKWHDEEKAEYEKGEGRQGSVPYFPD